MHEDALHIDRSLDVLHSAGGRRNLMGSLGAAGLALLTVVGLGNATVQSANADQGTKNGTGTKSKGKSNKSASAEGKRRKRRSQSASPSTTTAAPTSAAARKHLDPRDRLGLWDPQALPDLPGRWARPAQPMVYREHRVRRALHRRFLVQRAIPVGRDLRGRQAIKAIQVSRATGVRTGPLAIRDCPEKPGKPGKPDRQDQTGCQAPWGRGATLVRKGSLAIQVKWAPRVAQVQLDRQDHKAFKVAGASPVSPV